MENLYIKATDYTPKIELDAQSGVFDIEGESYHDQTIVVYQPVIEWISQFIKEANVDVVFNFKMTYYNTITSRRFLEMFDLLEEYQERTKKNILINWFYGQNDVDILEGGKEFAIDTRLDFNFIAK